MYKIESIFHYSNSECVVIFHGIGHRCGYVSVKRDHPLYGMDYSDKIYSSEVQRSLENTELDKRGIIPSFCWDGKGVPLDVLFNVHGSLTYSGSGCYPITRSYRPWWFGFDCAHCDDAKDWEAFQKYFPKRAADLYEIESRFSQSGEVRSQEYVALECKNLAEQLNLIRLYLE